AAAINNTDHISADYHSQLYGPLIRFYFLYLDIFFFFNETPTTEIYTLSLHDALPIYMERRQGREQSASRNLPPRPYRTGRVLQRSEEHTSELQSRSDLVCRLLLEKKKPTITKSRVSCNQRNH